MNFTKQQTYIILIGLALMLSYSFVLYAIFLEAYFNNYVAIFEINIYGEALFEFVFMPAGIILGLYALHLVVKDLRSRRCENQKR